MNIYVTTGTVSWYKMYFLLGSPAQIFERADGTAQWESIYLPYLCIKMKCLDAIVLEKKLSELTHKQTHHRGQQIFHQLSGRLIKVFLWFKNYKLWDPHPQGFSDGRHFPCLATHSPNMLGIRSSPSAAAEWVLVPKLGRTVSNPITAWLRLKAVGMLH